MCVRSGQRPRGESRRRGQGNMRVGQRRRQGKKQAGVCDLPIGLFVDSASQCSVHAMREHSILGWQAS